MKILAMFGSPASHDGHEAGVHMRIPLGELSE